MTHNVLALGEGGDFHHKCSYEAHTSNLRKTVIRSTEPPLLPNRCYVLPFFRSMVCQVCTMSALSLCVGLVALLIFLGLACAVAKKQMCHQMRWHLWHKIIFKGRSLYSSCFTTSALSINPVFVQVIVLFL